MHDYDTRNSVINMRVFLILLPWRYDEPFPIIKGRSRR